MHGPKNECWENREGDKMKGQHQSGDVQEEMNMGQESIALRLIRERQLDGNRMGINDDFTNTNLISKNYSPLFIRKYNAIYGWPLYVSMIVDEDISDIDSIVNEVIRECKKANMIDNNTQNLRNFTGILSETLLEHYNNKKENCVEGIAITLYIDKMIINNYFGDYMNHSMCRSEHLSLLNFMTQV